MTSHPIHNPEDCDKKYVMWSGLSKWLIGILGAGAITAFGLGVYSTETKNDVNESKQNIIVLDNRITKVELKQEYQLKEISSKLDTLLKRN